MVSKGPNTTFGWHAGWQENQMKMLCVSALVLTSTLSLAAQQLDESSVAAALKAGQEKKFDRLVSDCNATAGFGAAMAAGMAGGLQRDNSFEVVASLAP